MRDEIKLGLLLALFVVIFELSSRLLPEPSSVTEFKATEVLFIQQHFFEPCCGPAHSANLRLWLQPSFVIRRRIHVMER